MFPSNIELLLDDSIFLNNQTFTHRINPAQETSRNLEEVCDLLWIKYDADNSGSLEIDEVQQLLKDIAANSPPPYNVYDDTKAQQILDTVDTNGNGKIERTEMANLLKTISLLQGKDAGKQFEAIATI